MPASRLDRLRALEGERSRLLVVEKPALEARWLRALGDVQLRAVALEVDCKRWTAVVRHLQEGLARGALPFLEEAQAAVRAELHADFARLERWQREVQAATARAAAPPAPASSLRTRPAAASQPYDAARDAITAQHHFDLAGAIASLEQEIATIRANPPFSYESLIDDPAWTAAQRAQLEDEARALEQRRDRQRQLAEVLAAGPLG
ncbi:MAG: hypothetical protein MUE41_11140 [Gemmatimonadaceae bacterium]|jgi:hypothetical protein|nr:hypothetical protein [Gemmatimonadaceae bacterium]